MRELTNPPGVAPPADFQGALPLVYATGPGPAVVSIDVNNDIRPGLIHNIFATIPGRDYGSPKDRAVLLGNHRDAWVYGAADPNSGTAQLLEVANALGALLAKGWRPLRTLVLCSWSGEEYGLLGSLSLVGASRFSSYPFADVMKHGTKQIAVQCFPGSNATLVYNFTIFVFKYKS